MSSDGEIWGTGETGRLRPQKPPTRVERWVMRFSVWIRDLPWKIRSGSNGR